MDEKNNYLYNKSIRNAYSSLIQQKASRGPRNSEFSTSAVVPDEDDSEFSDRESYLEEGERTVGYTDEEGQEDEELLEHHDGDYEQFKKSMLQDEWIEDDSEEDKDYSDSYIEEADQGFIADGYSYPDYYSYEEDSPRHSRKMLWLLFLIACFVFVLFFATRSDSASSIVATTPDLNKKLTNIQSQINQIYHESDVNKKNYQSELDKTIKLIISQFEKNIKKLFPSGLKDVQILKSDLQKLNTKVQDLSESLSLGNVTQWQDQLMGELPDLLPQEIPVVINGNSTMMVIPEFSNYLSKIIPAIAAKSVPNITALEYNLNDYVKEVLANEFQYIDKSYFLRELEKNLQSNKYEILQEVEQRLSRETSFAAEDGPKHYSHILLRKMIHKIYNANQHQWENDLNFATFAQGTRLLNHLCSKTFATRGGIYGNEVSPVELLADSNHSPSTYWLCDGNKDCSWAIRFNQPLYLTKLTYVHGRFTNNCHMMDSAPKKVAVYIKLATQARDFLSAALANGFGESLKRDRGFIKIGTWNYEIEDARIRQDFSLPAWFIQLKPLVRSIAFLVEENHGGKHYTSLRKFIVNGVTPLDLQIMDQTKSHGVQKLTPEYAIPWDEEERQRASKVARWQQQNVKSSHEVPSFGQDEIDG